MARRVVTCDVMTTPGPQRTDQRQNSGLAPPAVLRPVTPTPGETAHRARPAAFVILLMGVFCMGMGQTVVFAVLPPIAREIGLGDFQVGSVFMLSAMLWVVMSPRWGRLSDRWGRRPLILLGIGGFTVSMVLFATAIRVGMEGALTGFALYALILGMRLIYGLIGSAQPAAAQAYIADRTTAQTRTKGLAGIGAAFGLGTTIGPAFAGATVALGPLAPLYGVAAAGALAFVSVFAFLPEHNPPKERAAGPRVRLTDARLRPFLIAGVAGGAISAIPVQMLGFYTIDILGVGNEEALAKVSVALTASAIASFFAQTVLVGGFSLKPGTLLRAGPLFLVLGHALFFLAASFPQLVVAAFFSGLGWGMLMPGFGAAASLAVRPEEQGATAGLTNSAGASGFILAPLIGFQLYALDPRGPFILTSLAAVALAAFVWRNGQVRALSRSPNPASADAGAAGASPRA